MQRREGEVCTVANDNDPSQVVLSGHKGAIDRAIAMAKEMGAKRAVPLPVSAPFHCPLMQPAADAMADALGTTVIAAAGSAALRQCHRRSRSPIPSTIRNAAGRAGDRHGPLAREHRQYGRGRRRGIRRAGRQGARPDGQAHRPRRQGDQRRHDRGYRSAREGDSHDVRPDGNDGAGDRRSGGLGSSIAKALPRRARGWHCRAPMWTSSRLSPRSSAAIM